jgi:hypothetical protein
VVENGDAIGSCKAHGLAPDVLLTSEPHQSYARTAGLWWLRKNGGGQFVMFDSDDYYGAGYVDRMLRLLAESKADVVGFSGFFVLRDWSRLVHYPGVEGPALSVAGPSICGWSERVPNYAHPGANSWDDDGKFCADVLAGGGSMFGVSPRHHFYRRHTANIWKMSDEKTDAIFQLRADGQPIDYGTVTEQQAADIVNSPELHLGVPMSPIDFHAQRNALLSA